MPVKEKGGESRHHQFPGRPLGGENGPANLVGIAAEHHDSIPLPAPPPTAATLCLLRALGSTESAAGRVGAEPAATVGADHGRASSVVICVLPAEYTPGRADKIDSAAHQVSHPASEESQPRHADHTFPGKSGHHGPD